MTAPVTVEQVIDHDTYTVQVTLNPDQILLPLARALRGHNEKLMLIRHLPAEHPEHQRARDVLLRILADTFTVTLTPDQAETLGGDLYEATTMPEQCHHCSDFATTTVHGFPLCQGHGRAYDNSVEESVKA